MRRPAAAAVAALFLLAGACADDDGAGDEAAASTSSTSSSLPEAPIPGATAPTGTSSPLCAAAEAYRTADEAVTAAATGAFDGQERAEAAWHAALAALEAAVQPGPEQDAARVLQGATTTVSDQPFTPEQAQADALLTVFLDAACPQI